MYFCFFFSSGYEGKYSRSYVFFRNLFKETMLVNHHHHSIDQKVDVYY